MPYQAGFVWEPEQHSGQLFQSGLNPSHWPNPLLSPWPWWWQCPWQSYQPQHQENCCHQSRQLRRSLWQWMAWSLDHRSEGTFQQNIFNQTLLYLWPNISHIVTSQSVEAVTVVTSSVSLDQHSNVFCCMLPTAKIFWWQENILQKTIHHAPTAIKQSSPNRCNSDTGMNLWGILLAPIFETICGISVVRFDDIEL